MPRLRRRLILLLIVGCQSLILISPLSLAKADPITVTALVAAKPENFQLSLNSKPSPGPVGSGQIITITLTYGSYLSRSVDSIVLVVGWQQDPASPAIVKYVENSATPAIQGSQPQINLSQQTITWTISPLPSGLDRTITWQLQVDPQHLSQTDMDVAVTASLTGPGLQVVAQPLRFIYQPTLLTTTPTPTGALPSLIPSSPQPTISLQPSITPVNGLAILLLVLVLLFITWLIRRQFIVLLWLFYRHQTQVHGLVSLNQQPLAQATVVVHHQSIFRQSRTTDRGHYRLRLKPGRYTLEVFKDNQLLHHQSLTIDPQQRGQQVQLSLALPLAGDTIK